jgi:hypothetical protein
MPHEYYEIPLWLLFEMSDTAFLDLCARYLVAALAEDKRMATDYEARDYSRRYLGVDWTLGL